MNKITRNNVYHNDNTKLERHFSFFFSSFSMGQGPVRVLTFNRPNVL